MKRLYTALALLCYAALPVLANWMIGNVGIPLTNGPHVLPVGFGLYAPSGVLAAAGALALRDAVQELAGRRGAIGAILAGAAISYLVASPAIAVASGGAFLLSEALDFAVYTPLRERGQVVMAVLASNTVGLLVDTLVFLALANLLTPSLFAGQVLGKLYIGAGAALVVYVYRRRLSA